MSACCPTKNVTARELGRREAGVSLASERGTTQTAVKAPKGWLSVKGGRMLLAENSEEVGSEAAIL